MTECYKPTSRRPIAGVFRAAAHPAVRICLLFKIHPDAISYSSIAASALAAVCFWRAASSPWMLLFGPLFCYIRLWLNMLDGMVALASGKAGARGEIMNDVPDRISDVLIFAGVAHSGLCSPFSGYWAAILALLTAYVGTLGAAVGARREYGGMMSKPWRMVALHIGAWLTFANIQFRAGDIHWAHLTILDWTCLFIIIGCLQTIAVRLKRVFAVLRLRETRT